MLFLKIFYHLGLVSKSKYDEKILLKNIKKSGFFDEKYYLRKNPDVAKAKMNPIKHYLEFGWKEGRNPSLKFNNNAYLYDYYDVKAEKICPLVHFINCGQSEGRHARAVGAEKSVYINGYSRNKYKAIKKSGLFDKRWYLNRYPDVARAKINPINHYLEFGWLEGRNPSPKFDNNWYLKKYPDVRNGNINPLYHYIKYGYSEGRIAQKLDGEKLLYSNCNYILKYPVLVYEEYAFLKQEVSKIKK